MLANISSFTERENNNFLEKRIWLYHPSCTIIILKPKMFMTLYVETSSSVGKSGEGILKNQTGKCSL